MSTEKVLLGVLAGVAQGRAATTTQAEADDFGAMVYGPGDPIADPVAGALAGAIHRFDGH